MTDSIGNSAPATPHAGNGLSKPLRVLILDSNVFTSELLKAALQRHGFELLCSALTLDDAGAALRTFSPDVVVVYCRCCADGRCAEGMERLRNIVAMAASKRVIVLLDDGEEAGVIEAFRAGARGVFHRSQALPQLVRCIQAVSEGQIWASSAELSLVLQAFASSQRLQCVNADGEDLLSPRENQVLDLIAEGLSNHDIAERLQISEHTVKNHLFKMYQKIGISTRVELVLFAVSRRAIG